MSTSTVRFGAIARVQHWLSEERAAEMAGKMAFLHGTDTCEMAAFNRWRRDEDTPLCESTALTAFLRGWWRGREMVWPATTVAA